MLDIILYSRYSNKSQTSGETMNLNLYTLLEKVQSGEIATKSYNYANSETNILFVPNTVMLEDVVLKSLTYKEWDETFYITGTGTGTANGKPEFLKCSEGHIQVKVH